MDLTSEIYMLAHEFWSMAISEIDAYIEQEKFSILVDEDMKTKAFEDPQLYPDTKSLPLIYRTGNFSKNSSRASRKASVESQIGKWPERS